MTPERAKELLPIIQAFVEGKTIQCRDPARNNWVSIGNPTFDNGIEFRIKPEKKVGWANIYAYCSTSRCQVHPSKEEADTWAAEARIACIRIEYDEGEGL